MDAPDEIWAIIEAEDGDFSADIVVNNDIIVELKSVESLSKAHDVQLVNYLNALKTEVGLLINFGPNGVQVKRKYRKSEKPKAI